MKIKIPLFAVIICVVMIMLVSPAAAVVSDTNRVTEANIGKGLVKDGAGVIADTAAAQNLLKRASGVTGFTAAVCIMKRGETDIDDVGDTARRYYDKTYGVNSEGVLLYIDDVSRLGVVYYSPGEKPQFKDNIFSEIFNDEVKSVLPDYDSAVTEFVSSLVDTYLDNHVYDDTAYETTDGDTAYDKAVASYRSEAATATAATAATASAGVRSAVKAGVGGGSAAGAALILVKDSTGSITNLAAAQTVLERAAAATGLTVAVCITKTGDNDIDRVGDTARIYYDKTYGINTAGVLLYIDNASRIGFVYYSRGAKSWFNDRISTAVFNKDVKPVLPDYDRAAAVFAQSVTDIYNRGGIVIDDDMLKFGAVVFVIAAAAGIVTLIIHIKVSYKLKQNVGVLPYLKDIKFTHRSDVFTRSYTTSRRIQSSSGGGGGGSHSSGGGGGGGRF